MNRKKNNQSGIVYSTDPDFQVSKTESIVPKTVAPENQAIKIRLETKHRAGKTVTLLEGFSGSAEEGEALIKKLKNYCGSGGSSKDAELLIQGDHRDKVLQWLLKNGFPKSRKI